jgi:hypothetical protein
MRLTQDLKPGPHQAVLPPKREQVLPQRGHDPRLKLVVDMPGSREAMVAPSRGP